MKKLLFLSLFLMGSLASLQAQIYDKVAHFFQHGTVANGLKIKTNIPFTSGADMTTLHLYGYSYGNKAPINIQLSFYIWTNAGTTYFYNPVMSSSGAYTPTISLASESGKVVVYLADRVYYQHLCVDAFFGFTKPDYYKGWTIVDEPLTGTAITVVSYKNAFKGDITLPDGIWNANGNVGIGTANPQAKLAVDGNILAKEVKVKTDIAVPDYVFESDYPLSSLADIEQYVKKHKHLPEIPSATELAAQGLDLAEMNLLLLKKVEELTLYMIEQQKQLGVLESQLEKIMKK